MVKKAALVVKKIVNFYAENWPKIVRNIYHDPDIISQAVSQNSVAAKKLK
jgi:hypothetical protein